MLMEGGNPFDVEDNYAHCMTCERRPPWMDAYDSAKVRSCEL